MTQALIGAIVVLASLVILGAGIFARDLAAVFQAREVADASGAPGEDIIVGPAQVTPGEPTALAVRYQVSGELTEGKPRYELPVSFSVTDSNGSRVAGGDTVIKSYEGTKAVTATSTNGHAFTSTATAYLTYFDSPKSGQVKASVHLKPPEASIRVTTFKAIVYRGARRMSVFRMVGAGFGAAFALAMLIVAAVGLLAVRRRSSHRPVPA